LGLGYKPASSLHLSNNLLVFKYLGLYVTSFAVILTEFEPQGITIRQNTDEHTGDKKV
jgi:hypothetical protein